MSAHPLTIALAGNPNVGKSTLFNALTGARQHVGNWPGKTVAKKEGTLRLDGQEIVIVDLPGTYSLTAYSIEEIISRDFILNERPEAVVAVVDAANLERNLYLVTQLFELEVPVILVLNMSDVACSRGLVIDAKRLSAQMNGAPVIESVGTSGTGLEGLKGVLRDAARGAQIVPPRLSYAAPLERELAALETAIRAEPSLAEQYRPRWLAVKLLEADEEIIGRLAAYQGLLEAAEAAAERIEAETDEDAETLITDGRYAAVNAFVTGALTRPRERIETTSDKIDRLLTHRIWGVPIFLMLMWLVFQVTANVSAPFLDWVDGFISGPVTNRTLALFGLLGLSGSWLEALVVNGVIAGVGGVLVFIPVLVSLYLVIGLLEDSGYMARAAFVMDRAMRVIGLHGKSFLPMLVGFGCTVPAVYSTRTLEHEADRKLTGFLLTFMSCGARLPVYVIIGAAFFGAKAGNLIFGMYMLGIVVALLTGWLLKRTVYRNKPPQPFVMELPPYRLPNLRDIWRQTWDRTSSFVRKASTLVLGTSVLIWFLMATPTTAAGRFNAVAPDQSLFGSLSRLVAPIFAPAGFGNWQAAGSLISGFVAKEVVVSTMSQIYVGDTTARPESLPSAREDLVESVTSFGQAAILTVQEIVNIVPRTVNLLPGVTLPEADFLHLVVEEESTSDLETALRQLFTPLAAVAFCVFVLLYTPCMTAVAAMRHEFGPRFTLYQIGYTLAVAWLGAVLVYQVGRLVGMG